MSIYNHTFDPAAEAGQLVGIQFQRDLYPSQWRRVVKVAPLSFITITVSANASAQEQATLELQQAGLMAQYRLKQTTANSNIQVVIPQGSPVGNTNSGAFYINDTLDTNFGTINGRALTNFFVYENAKIFFNELNGTQGTVDVSGWKYTLAPVTQWPIQNMLAGQETGMGLPSQPAYKMVDPKTLAPEELGFLFNYAGAIPVELGG